MALKYLSIEEKLKDAGLPSLIKPDEFNTNNLRLDLLDILNSKGLPEDHIAIVDNADIKDGALSIYRAHSQFKANPSILFNIMEHFKFVFYNEQETYSEFKVKDLIMFSLLYAYGHLIYEYFNSEKFHTLYKAKPYKVNQISRIMNMFFPTKNILGNCFANYAMDKLQDSHRKDALIICIEEFALEHFSQEDIELSKFSREERKFRQDVDYLCSEIPLQDSMQMAMDNNRKIVIEVAQFFKRHKYEDIQILRGEGYIGENFPQKLEEQGLQKFLFSHEVVLYNGNTIIDFCALAYGQENPIMVGPKYKWKKLWNDFSKAHEIPNTRQDAKDIELVFHSTTKIKNDY